MPNWVSNSVRVTGNKEDLQRFAEQAGQTTTQFGEERERHLSFWNFVEPSDLEHYKEHWYEWNMENWGVTWDASDVYFETWSDNELAYDFETPWSVPESAFRAMSFQYPELVFRFRFLEEQGWGGEMLGENGGLFLLTEWDIPETHEERMEYIGYCWCEEMRDDEAEHMFEDCPRKVELANATTV